MYTFPMSILFVKSCHELDAFGARAANVGSSTKIVVVVVVSTSSHQLFSTLTLYKRHFTYTEVEW